MKVNVYLTGAFSKSPQFIPASLVGEVRTVRLARDSLELVEWHRSPALGLAELLQGSDRIVLTRHPRAGSAGSDQLPSINNTNS